MSKGSAQRPGDKQRFSDNYDRIFGHKKASEKTPPSFTEWLKTQPSEINEGSTAALDMHNYAYKDLTTQHKVINMVTSKEEFDSLPEEHKTTIIQELRKLASEGTALESNLHYVRCHCVPGIYLQEGKVQMMATNPSVPDFKQEDWQYYLPPWEYLEMFLPQ